MWRILLLHSLLLPLSFVSAQVPLTNFTACQDDLSYSITDYIQESNHKISDTIIFCMLAEFIKEPDTQRIEQVIDFVHRKAAQCLQAGYFTLSKEYRSIQAHLAIEINNDSIYMEALYQIALSSYRMGDVLDAARYNMEGKIIAIRDSYHMRHISFLYRESWIFWRMLRNEKAIQSMEECKALAAIHSPNQGYIFSYHNGLGSFYRSMKEFELARFHQDSAIYYSEKLCFVRAKAIAKSNRANAYEQGDTSHLDLRFELSKEALNVSQKQMDREQIASNFSLLGSLQLLANNFNEALEMYDSAYYYTKITNDRIRELHAYQGKSKAYEGLGDFEKSLVFEKQQFSLHKELYGASTMSDVYDLEQASLEREADFRLEKVTLQNDLKTLKLQREKNNMLILLLAALVASLLAMFLFYRKKQRQEIDLLVLKQESQNRIIELEKKALQSQMNPHFIFNSLNSIKSHIAKNEARTATRFLNKFSQLMRIILTSSNANLVPLSEELNSLRLYIELEQFRLNKSFDFEIINKIGSTQSQEILIPPLIIQPYVENAIWHGLVPKEDSKKLEVEIFAENEELSVFVRDNGIGRKKSTALQNSKAKLHKSMGMQITKERIKLHNDNDDHISVKFLDLMAPDGLAIGSEVQLTLSIKRNKND